MYDSSARACVYFNTAGNTKKSAIFSLNRVQVPVKDDKLIAPDRNPCSENYGTQLKWDDILKKCVCDYEKKDIIKIHNYVTSHRE